MASFAFTKERSIVDMLTDRDSTATGTDNAVVDNRHTRAGRSMFAAYKATTSTRRKGQAKGVLQLFLK